MKLFSSLRNKPLISLLHTTARVPDGWQRAFAEWARKADHLELIEYVLCTDDGALKEKPEGPYQPYGSLVWVENLGRRCAVDGWNAAAEASSGKFLITVSDDLFPPEHWDTDILTAVGDLDRQCVIDIEAGSGSLMTFSLLSRAYYERYGYIFYPEYIGMMGDNDFTNQAHRDGVVVNAKHLVFRHEHPAYGTAKSDDVYSWQHRREAWDVGRAVYKKRWPGMYRPTLAVMCPGENFSSKWVNDLLRLVITLSQRVNLMPIFCYSSNVHVTRGALADSVTRKLGASAPPDFVLSIDDDNTLSGEQYLQLMADLEARPDLDIVAGWCWSSQDFSTKDKISCGRLNAKDLAEHFSWSDLEAAPDHLVPIDFTGFPVVLMRQTAIERAMKHAPAENCFAPAMNPNHPWGFNSEDVSFSIYARAAGLKMAVDRRVKVPHFKLAAPDPGGFGEKWKQFNASLEGESSQAADGLARKEDAA